MNIDSSEVRTRATLTQFASVGEITLLALLLICPLLTSAQKIDSLTSLLPGQTGLSRLSTLYELAYEYVDLDNIKSLHYVEEASLLADSIGDTLWIVRTGRIKSLIFRRLENIDSSIAICLKILPIAERHNLVTETMHLLNGLGIAYIFTAEFDKALDFHLKSLQLRESSGTPFDVSVALHNIGLVYFLIKDYRKATSYFIRSLRMKEKIGSSLDIEVLLINLGYCYANLGDLTSARNMVTEVSKRCKIGCTDMILSQVWLCFGEISMKAKEYSKAKIQFYKGYKYAKAANNIRQQMEGLISLAQLNIQLNKVQDAERVLNDAESLVTVGTRFNEELLDIYRAFLSLYSKSGNKAMLSQYQTKYIELKDSIFHEEMLKNLMQIEVDYTERENRLKVEAQARVIELNNDVINRQKTLTLVSYVVAALSTALAFLLIKSINQKKNANRLLEQRVKERTLELELNHEALAKALRERNLQFTRISSEIKNSLATIRGLGLLVSHDLGTPNGSSYLAKIEETSDNLIKGLSRVQDQQL